MLVEKEIIAPGQYFYTDEATGLPRKLDVTPEMTKYWRDQGSAMLGSGLTIPIPFEHDFNSHPMTPKDKLLNNSGWLKEYRVKDAPDGRKDVLFGVCDITDPDIAKKLPHTIRWTSPWINSFTDGQGKQWNNVISHLALTTRPRIVKQAPFGSIAAALSLATEVKLEASSIAATGTGGFCLSRAGRLFTGVKSHRLRARYPMAFSLWGGGIKLGDDDMPPKKKSKPKTDNPAKKDSPGEGGEGGGLDNLEGGEDFNGDLPDEEGTGDDAADIGGLMNPLQDSRGDVKMEELLCDLLSALGVMMPENVGESEFKRALYEAAMAKIKELASKGLASTDMNAQAGAANTTSPAGPAGGGQPNPLVQQEQQPMFMSLEEIHKIADPTMKGVALAMYGENQKLRAEVDASAKTANGLRDAKLKEATATRSARVAMIGKLSPRTKVDLDAMLAMPSMALSMGDGGSVVDPMAQTLAVLEKGLADIPRLLTTDASALSIQPQPTDAEMSQETTDKMSDDFARMMGCPPQKKAG